MQYIKLPRDGRQVSRFGVGVLRMPKVDGKIDPTQAKPIIRYAIDHGVNFFDTAYMYEGSEVALGHALEDGYRDKVILSTKLPIYAVKSKDDLKRYFDEELKRLRTDYLDYYLLHGLNVDSWATTLKYDVLDFLTDLKEKGLVKHVGFSVHESFDFFKEVVDAYDWDLVMVQYNYYDKFNQVGQKGVQYAHSKGIAVATMESLHGGMLANDVPKDVEDAFADWKTDVSNAEKSFMWLYNQEEVSIILSGVSNLDQLKDNLRIFDNAQSNCLSDEENALFDDARKAWYKNVHVECTGCGYCMPCPVGVDIPTIFQHYNLLINTKEQKWVYDTMVVASGKDPSKCIACGKCEKHCPQSIKIIDELKNADKVLRG
ncbi:aldo/keto reductase [Acidaminobacter sp. JC074]|uniref:aldo/keto reductase n=1 Tax=Acidaminobacter sp. JC074 TaxID=2530199 RepID=UPI001F0FA9E7|nr:aldo/keto reductase [Acidaminobacter sp. JC074]MCH4889211.1 aldo/keto reductase [Acidaminobacter sp. JC074]